MRSVRRGPPDRRARAGRGGRVSGLVGSGDGGDDLAGDELDRGEIVDVEALEHHTLDSKLPPAFQIADDLVDRPEEEALRPPLRLVLGDAREPLAAAGEPSGDL